MSHLSNPVEIEIVVASHIGRMFFRADLAYFALKTKSGDIRPKCLAPPKYKKHYFVFIIYKTDTFIKNKTAMSTCNIYG